MSKGSPMRITARLRCAVQGDPYLPIDGILYSALMRQTFGAQEVTVAGSMAQFGGEHGSLPLKRVAPPGGPWYYAASFAEWAEPWVDDSSFWAKRFDMAHADLIDFDGRRASITLSEGRYKGYQIPTFSRHALEVRWYAVGNLERVRDLLAGVTHIGKKVAQGCGRVNAWQVEEWPDDWSVWRTGRLMRAVPRATGTLYGIRPPYWRPANQYSCALPG